MTEAGGFVGRLFELPDPPKGLARARGNEPTEQLHAYNDRLLVAAVEGSVAVREVVANHYLHRRPPCSFSYAVFDCRSIVRRIVGVVTYGTPPSRHLQISACPSDPSAVIELNRLWLQDGLPKNTASWFVSRTLKMLPARIVVSYADPLWGHYGYVYRALNFHYAGWTDMERKTPRYDYLPADPTTHTRDAFRNGYVAKRRRVAKVKYWTVSGSPAQRRELTRLCGWPTYDWRTLPPPMYEAASEETAG